MSWEYPPVVVGGLGRHVDALTRELAALGHDVVVLTRQPTGSAGDVDGLADAVVRTLADPDAAAGRAARARARLAPDASAGFRLGADRRPDGGGPGRAARGGRRWHWAGRRSPHGLTASGRRSVTSAQAATGSTRDISCKGFRRSYSSTSCLDEVVAILGDGAVDGVDVHVVQLTQAVDKSGPGVRVHVAHISINALTGRSVS